MSDTEQNVNSIIPIDIEFEMKRAFIDYAMSVIIDRALPDVRDGMKPVHRRILYSMFDMGFMPDKPYRKCMATIGNVQGKYHPHGDAAIYDSLVRMGQDFVMRYPLIDGQGNFGSRDGDPPGAARYTEARLAKISLEMMADIKKDTVDFRPNYDEHEMEPAVLPCKFPNLIVNGTTGIAVGMASNIPPHNLCEIIDGINMIIDNPEVTPDDLLSVIKGPDFPTRANILGRMGIREMYRTGRGKMIVRAECTIESLPNGKSCIIVSELPYMVNKAKLITRIADLVKDKRIEGISDLRDESDREHEVRIYIELKRDANANVVLNLLYKHTPLQEVFSANMLAIVPTADKKCEPRVLNIRQILDYYINHQREVITNRTRFDLEKAEARAHILEGYMIAVENLEEVIRIIRASKNVADAKINLMNRFNFSDTQAQHIVDMTLGRLTNLEVLAIRQEYDDLQKAIARYREILSNIHLVDDIIKDELSKVRAKYGDERRTKILQYEGEIDIDDLIHEEDVVITMTNCGYIKRLPTDTYKSQRRGGKGIIGMTTKDEDFVKDIFVCSSHEMILFFTNKGRVYKLKAYEIPETGRQSRGMAIINLLQLDSGEKINTVITQKTYESEKYLTLITRNGLVKKTKMTEYSNIRKGGLTAVSLRDDDELVGVAIDEGENDIIITTKKGQSIRFANSDIRPIGRVSQGVKAITLDDDDYVISMNVIHSEEEVLLFVTEKGFGKRTCVNEFRTQGRGGKGVMACRLTEKNGNLAGAIMVDESDDLIVVADDGTIIRMDVNGINVFGRGAQGVTIMRLAEGSSIVGIARAEKEEPDDEESAEEVIDANESDNEGDTEVSTETEPQE